MEQQQCFYGKMFQLILIIEYHNIPLVVFMKERYVKPSCIHPHLSVQKKIIQFYSFVVFYNSAFSSPLP